MDAGSSTKSCVNPKYPVLHLGVSVLSVCHAASLSQRRSPNTSVKRSNIRVPASGTLWVPEPPLSNADLPKSHAWTSRPPWLNTPWCSPCAAEPRSLVCSQLHTLVVMIGGWGCWVAAQGQERAVKFMHPGIPVRGTFVHHRWEFCPSRPGELIHTMHLPMCERSQTALCGRMSRMDPPYTPPFQVCFSQEHFFPSLLDLL